MSTVQSWEVHLGWALFQKGPLARSRIIHTEKPNSLSASLSSHDDRGSLIRSAAPPPVEPAKSPSLADGAVVVVEPQKPLSSVLYGGEVEELTRGPIPIRWTSRKQLRG
jgi:hypothetical protein